MVKNYIYSYTVDFREEHTKVEFYAWKSAFQAVNRELINMYVSEKISQNE